eukprot:422951-Prymnesium_polylepis.1
MQRLPIPTLALIPTLVLQAILPQVRAATASARRRVYQGHHPQPTERSRGRRLACLVRPRPDCRG